MVAVIHTGYSLSAPINYNENKVKAGAANLIHASGYPKDIDRLGMSDKLMRLKNQAALNQETKRNSVHISLNFHPGEKLSVQTLTAIADSYMQQIGFGDQPYLVYEHTDAGHPHIHIVTSNIQDNGKRIDTFNIGKFQSKKAREEIENTFGLVKAKQQNKSPWQPETIDVHAVKYGAKETKKAIANVVTAVLKNYKFTSLQEMNAVLRLYNVAADPGGEDSKMFREGGLRYHLLDETGQKIGIPIKASLLPYKPGLKELEKKFKRSKSDRDRFLPRIRNRVDWILIQNPGITLQELSDVLKGENIVLVLRQNNQGLIYGITYVDHKTKCVANGSDLGKEYSAKRMQERCNRPHAFSPRPPIAYRPSKDYIKDYKTALFPNLKLDHSGLFYDLLKPIEQEHIAAMPYELRTTRKKKKKRRF